MHGGAAPRDRARDFPPGIAVLWSRGIGTARAAEGRTSGMERMRIGIPAAVLAVLVRGAPAGAQTDYYNTDEGRPVRVEDAYPTERYAFELQLAPVRLERE